MIFNRSHSRQFLFFPSFFFKNSGFCYRLFTEETFETLAPTPEPEIKRVNISSVILLLKACGIHDILGFPFLDRPSRTSILRALEQLYSLSALDDQGNLMDIGKCLFIFFFHRYFRFLFLDLLIQIVSFFFPPFITLNLYFGHVLNTHD